MRGTTVTIVLVGVVAAHGCGDGSPVSGGSVSLHAAWQQGNGDSSGSAQAGTGCGQNVTLGFGPTIPPAVSTIRISVESPGNDFRCCVDLDRDQVPAAPPRRVVIADLPDGVAEFTLLGYQRSVRVGAATEPVCVLRDLTGLPCNVLQPDTPSFRSLPNQVPIVAGTRADGGTMQMFSLPFVLAPSLVPAPGVATADPTFAFTVVDAGNGIDGQSIKAESTQDGPPGTPGVGLTPIGDPFVAPCSDAAPPDSEGQCSDGGQLGVSGYNVNGVAVTTHTGPAWVLISAFNRDGCSFELSYPFAVLPTPTPVPFPLGTGCSAGSDCASGFCVDSVCCESPSCPELVSCACPGFLGTCVSACPTGLLKKGSSPFESLRVSGTIQ